MILLENSTLRLCTLVTISSKKPLYPKSSSTFSQIPSFDRRLEVLHGGKFFGNIRHCLLFSTHTKSDSQASGDYESTGFHTFLRKDGSFNKLPIFIL
jgi:hypothetical protein